MHLRLSSYTISSPFPMYRSILSSFLSLPFIPSFPSAPFPFFSLSFFGSLSRYLVFWAPTIIFFRLNSSVSTSLLLVNKFHKLSSVRATLAVPAVESKIHKTEIEMKFLPFDSRWINCWNPYENNAACHEEGTYEGISESAARFGTVITLWT